jgi:CxxC-x17-CxxC domain-containing protein
MPAFKKSGGFKAGGFKPKRFEASDRPRFAKKSFGGASRARNEEGHDARLELYAATCANCHKTCEVPFRPNGQKPVFCRDCFGEKKGAPREFSKPTTSSDTSIEGLKRQLDAMNKKIDSLVKLVENLA